MDSEMRIALVVGILIGAVSAIAGHTPLGVATLVVGAIAMWYASWLIVATVYDKQVVISQHKEG